MLLSDGRTRVPTLGIDLFPSQNSHPNSCPIPGRARARPLAIAARYDSARACGDRNLMPSLLAYARRVGWTSEGEMFDIHSLAALASSYYGLASEVYSLFVCIYVYKTSRINP